MNLEGSNKIENLTNFNCLYLIYPYCDNDGESTKTFVGGAWKFNTYCYVAILYIPT